MDEFTEQLETNIDSNQLGPVLAATLSLSVLQLSQNTVRTEMVHDPNYFNRHAGVDLFLLNDPGGNQVGRSISFAPGRTRFELFTREKTNNFGFDQNRINFSGTSSFQGAGPFYSPQGNIEGRTIQDGVELQNTDPASQHATAFVVFRDGNPEIHHTDDPGFNPQIDKTCDAFTQIPFIKNGSPNMTYLNNANMDQEFPGGLRFLVEVEGTNTQGANYTSFMVVHIDGPASQRKALSTLLGMDRQGSPARTIKNAIWLDMGSVSGGKLYGKPGAGGNLQGETIGTFTSATNPEAPYRATFIAGAR